MKRKGQSALEFTGLITFMFLVFFIFFFMIQNQVQDVNTKQNVALLGSLNSIVTTHAEVAWTSTPDFEHSFRLPVLAVDYTVSLVDEFTVVAYLPDGTQYIEFTTFPMRGLLYAPGVEQTVYRYDGEYINPATPEYVYDANLDGLFLNVPAEECAIAHHMGTCVVGYEYYDVCRSIGEC